LSEATGSHFRLPWNLAQQDEEDAAAEHEAEEADVAATIAAVAAALTDAIADNVPGLSSTPALPSGRRGRGGATPRTGKAQTMVTGFPVPFRRV